jgi:23S rRNA pseudouridine1911/1915/1917 synthase
MHGKKPAIPETLEVGEPQPGTVRYLATPDVAGQRLDQALAHLAGVPRRRARVLIEEGRLWLNTKTTRVLSRPLRLGDVLDVVPSGDDVRPGVGPPPPLPILYEDRWLIAVDKPAGLTTQPPLRRAPGELTAHERLLLQLAARDGGRREVLLFHRLDRLTTGVLVFARHHDAARGLTKVWGTPAVRKRYLVVVSGDPGAETKTFDGAIAHDALVPGRYRVARGGKPAATRVRRLARFDSWSLVEASPLTGRTHQVRVHLAEAGFPVAGDSLYGGSGGVPRPFLHAWRLSFPHPRGGPLLRLTAPVPPDMAGFLAAHGFPAEALVTT